MMAEGIFVRLTEDNLMNVFSILGTRTERVKAKNIIVLLRAEFPGSNSSGPINSTERHLTNRLPIKYANLRNILCLSVKMSFCFGNALLRRPPMAHQIGANWKALLFISHRKFLQRSAIFAFQP